MVDLKQARLLLEMADKDLRALKGMVDSQVFAEEIFGFHVQQAAEKSLKAWVALRGLDVPRTHQLSVLLDQLEQHGENVERFWGLVEYQMFAVQFRYETIGQRVETINRVEAIGSVEAVVDEVRVIEKAFK
jgi:HEPN domain-containing protein